MTKSPDRCKCGNPLSPAALNPRRLWCSQCAKEFELDGSDVPPPKVALVAGKDKTPAPMPPPAQTLAPVVPIAEAAPEPAQAVSPESVTLIVRGVRLDLVPPADLTINGLRVKIAP